MAIVLDLPVVGLFFKILKIKQKLRQIDDELGLNEKALQAYRLRQLKKVMALAYDTIPMYRDKWQAAGVGPDDLKTLDDLCKFPVVTKDDVRNAVPDVAAAYERSNSKTHMFWSTGSSGMPVTVLFDRDKGFYEIAEISTYSINKHLNRNLKKGMSILVLDDEAMEVLPAIEFPSFKRYLFDALDSVENHIEKINSVRPDYLVTYPSVLKNIALKALAENLSLHQPDMLLTTGESQDDHTRSIITRVFKGELINGYAATETGIMAVECPRHNGLHVLSYKAILEIVDDDYVLLPPGRPGNILLTELNNFAFPMIRYAGLGDIAGYKTEKCDCHLKALPLLTRIEGRKVDSFILPGGRVILPFHLTHLLLGIPRVQKFQIRQERKDEIRVLIIKGPIGLEEGPPLDDAEIIGLLQDRFSAVVGSDIAVSIEFVTNIPRPENSHKFPTAVSFVRE